MAEKIQQQAAPKLRVRFAKAEDAALVVKLVRELTEYQQEPLENVKLTEADIIRDSFGARAAHRNHPGGSGRQDGRVHGVLSQLFHLGRARRASTCWMSMSGNGREAMASAAG